MFLADFIRQHVAKFLCGVLGSGSTVIIKSNKVKHSNGTGTLCSLFVLRTCQLGERNYFQQFVIHAEVEALPV